MSSPIPLLIITAGDPAGIGPEVILKSLQAGRPAGCRMVVIGDREVFARTAQRLRCRLPGWAEWLSVGPPVRIQPGRATAASGAASLRYLDAAITLAQSHPRAALVTGPVTKWAIERSGTPFTGQTEYLAAAFRAAPVLMMFVSPVLRMALLTRHVPLRSVGARLTPALVRDSLALTLEGLRRRFGIARPRLAVCGVNPHAGESGLFGDEERRVLTPAIRRLRARGVRVDGPLAADGLFGGAWRDYDAVVCPSHDQGLVPFKLLARDRGCQVTLGLPVIRVSPDHGSALDIAGRGTAHPGSMTYAIRLAARLLRRG